MSTMLPACLLLQCALLTVLMTSLESGKLSDEEEWPQESGAWNSSSHQLAVRPHAAVTCLSDDECLTTVDGQRTGQRCHWLYDGCSTGLCTCDPVRQRRQQPSGKCLTVKLGEEGCSGSNEVCIDGMMCHQEQRTCYCKTGSMTPDRQHCLRKRHKLLNDDCLPSVDQCFQKTGLVLGYTSNDVVCSTKTKKCECVQGLKSDGLTCRNLRINEYGCAKFFHCEGGAVCVDGRCVCPTGYTSAASGTKCVFRNAVRDLPLGEACDEINEQSYCAQNLICHKCHPDRRHRLCVRCEHHALSNEASFSSSLCRSCLQVNLPYFPLILNFAITIVAITTSFQCFCFGGGR